MNVAVLVFSVIELHQLVVKLIDICLGILGLQDALQLTLPSRAFFAVYDFSFGLDCLNDLFSISKPSHSNKLKFTFSFKGVSVAIAEF